MPTLGGTFLEVDETRSLLDTSADVEDRQVTHWRTMSVRDRFDAVASLNESCELMAAAGVRLRYPVAGPDEVRLRALALRLGRDLMVAAYGWDPDIEGW
jgi:hypothetical protein